jgi:hypothetical protein
MSKGDECCGLSHGISSRQVHQRSGNKTLKDPCILEALGELTALGVLPSLTTIRISSYIPAMFEDSALRLLIYDEIVRTGETPVVVTLTRLVGASLDDVRASLRRMHDAHMLVLQPTGEILMANPFSTVPTPFLAEVGGRRWFGNCIWDALGIIATLHADGRVLASCGSSGERMELSVSEGILAGQGTVHFALPARRWWEDIVFN